MSKPFGWELILDVHDADASKFTRDCIEEYLSDLCRQIKMDREDLHFWDYQDDDEGYDAAPAHLKGTSAVQFIKTSSIVIHTLDVTKRVYINIFSCKKFDPSEATFITEHFFSADVITAHFMERK